MKEWGPERTVRASVLRYLLVDSQAQVHSKGLRLRGARISGPLELESVTVRYPLLLESCYLDSPEPVTLDYAKASRVVLSRCHVLGGLTGNLLVVTKGLDLSESAFEGEVRLSGADITGPLLCHGAQLRGATADGNALIADEMKVAGDVFMDEGFAAAGAVHLPGADITGQLTCRSAQITGANADGALVADRIRVAGGAFLDQGFTAAGAVRLFGADITGQLSFRGADSLAPMPTATPWSPTE